MKRICAVMLGVTLLACSKSEGAPETVAQPVAPAPVVAAAPPFIPLDTLIMQLDSARGFFWPKTTRVLELTNAELHVERFRVHGKAAVQSLINCMTDTTSTSTYLGEHEDFKYPRGALCYEVLRQLTNVDESRQLPIHREDVYVSMVRADVKPELKRARRAWQVIHDARAYRLSVPQP